MSHAPVGSRRAALWLMGVFVTLALAAFIWGFAVVEEVRARAKRVDVALRSTAWACLVYADQEQAWPASEEALADAAVVWQETRLPSSGNWPGTRDEAMRGGEAVDSAQIALQLVGWNGGSDGAPLTLHSRGNPSGIGTLAEVNGWLAARGKLLPKPEPTTGVPSSR